jgi:hypothetical protein
LREKMTVSGERGEIDKDGDIGFWMIRVCGGRREKDCER